MGWINSIFPSMISLGWSFIQFSLHLALKVQLSTKESPWAWAGTNQTASSPLRNSMLPGQSPLPPKTPCIWELLHATQRSEAADFSAGSIQSCTGKINSVYRAVHRMSAGPCSWPAPRKLSHSMTEGLWMQTEPHCLSVLCSLKKTQPLIYYTCSIMLIQIGKNIPGIPWPALLKFLIINSEL